jgi:Ca-activated chloride channel family protein
MIKVDANPQAAEGMIYVPVMVSDSKGVPIATFNKDHFQVLEDGKEQKIEYFAGATEPVTVGIVMSLSANGPVKNPGQKDRTTVDITNAVDRIRAAHTASAPPSFSQLPLDSDQIFPSVTKGVDALSKDPARKKALVVITDGMTSSGMSGSSVANPKALLEASKVSSFPIHVLLLTPASGASGAPTMTEGSNLTVGFYLEQMAQFSGGELVVGQVENDLTSASSNLRDSLKNQYVLGYHSPNAAKDGKWRKLVVKVNPPAGTAKLKVNTRERYFVPKA